MRNPDRDDWLRVPRAGVPGGVLGQSPAADRPPEPMPAHESLDLLSPEHRDKLAAMLRWVAEGRRWDDVRGDVLRMFDLPDPATPTPQDAPAVTGPRGDDRESRVGR